MDFASLFNFAVSAGMASACLWAVLSDRFKDGVLMKLGLITMGTGFGLWAYFMCTGITEYYYTTLIKGMLLVNLGAVITGIAGWLRVRGECEKKCTHLRRRSDYEALFLRGMDHHGRT